MTVNATNVSSGPFFPNGSATTFPFDFEVVDTDEVAVTINGADVDPSTFSVKLNDDGTGRVIFFVAPPGDGATTRMFLFSNPDFRQQATLRNQGPYYQQTLEKIVDRLAIAALWLRDKLTRAAVIPFDPAPVIGKFPVVLGTGLWGWSNGTGADAGLRQDLAGPNGIDFVPSILTALATKAPVSTKSTGIGANLYPVDFRLGRDIPPHPFEYIPANQHAGIIAGATVYDCADDLQAMCDGWTPDVGKAGVIQFPNGVFSFGKKILFPNWVAWRGQGRGTQLFALAGHDGPYMFQFDSDPDKALGGTDPILDPAPQSRFNQRLEAFDINPRMDLAGRENLTRIIYAPSWNEKCGLRDIMARNVGCNFLYVDEWHGGSAGFQITDLEVFFTEDAYDDGVVGLSLNGRARGGGFITNRPQVTLRNVTMAGTKAGVNDANPGLVMIEVDNMHVQLLGAIHFERALVGIDCQNNADLTGFGLTGSDVAGRVVNLIYRSGSHTGRIDVRDMWKGGGGIKDLHDAVSGMHRTNAVGHAVSVPSLPGEAWATGRFKVAGAAVTESQLLGCSAVVRDGATGYYKVTHSDNMVSGDNYTAVASVFDDTACYVQIRASEKVGSTFHIRVYRISDNTLFDPAEVRFDVYRKPGS